MRTVKNINENWKVLLDTKEIPSADNSELITVNLPYTWNGKDGQDGGNDYKRFTSCFMKELTKEELTEREEVYIEFQGVNSSSDVYFNKKKVFTHHGGYSTFRVKIDNAEILEKNELAVLVDNSPNDFVYPQMADFTFYGGI